MLCAGLLWLAAQPAEAADRFVDGSTGSDAGNNCTGAGNPCATIARAVDVALAGDEIRIAAGVYTETLQIDAALTLRGAGRSATVIQAGATRGTASDRTVTVAAGVSLELFDLTLRHGNTALGGGGLSSDGGALRIERVDLVENDAGGRGAGLSAGGDGAVVVLRDVAVRDNGSASTDRAGGIDLGRNFSATDVTLVNVLFANNTAAQAGGLNLFNAQATLRDVRFIANVATVGEGGGLFYEGSNSVDASLLLRDVVFRGNAAAEDGGGLYTVFDTPYEIVNGLFSGNDAGGSGGGIANENSSTDVRVLTNVTLSGNRAAVRGGAIGEARNMAFRNTVIWNNLDVNGGGSQSASLSDFFSGDIVGVDHSLIQNFTATAFTGTGNLDGTDPASNPLFRDPVGPSGAPGLAGDLRLQIGSPVRDRGSNAFVSGIDTDLDGEARIFGGVVDLGPYEGTDVLFADGFEDAGF
jgi:hypothetical protein